MPLPKIKLEEIKNPVEQKEGKVISPRPAKLAPASARAGDDALAVLIRPELREKALAALEEGLVATKRFYDKEAGGWVAEPDYQTRVRAAELVLAYAEGRPVERKVELKGSFAGYDEKLEKLCATPVGLAAAIKLGLVSEGAALKSENA